MRDGTHSSPTRSERKTEDKFYYCSYVVEMSQKASKPTRRLVRSRRVGGENSPPHDGDGFWSIVTRTELVTLILCLPPGSVFEWFHIKSWFLSLIHI